MTLPAYEAQRSHEMQWAFSNKKQSDYDTVVLDADLLLTHPVREIAPAEISKEFRSDRETFGKGHEFATSMWEVARDVRKTVNVDGSSLILGWLLAFCLGKVDSEKQGETDAYKHEITFFDPDTEETAQLPVTTIVEKVATGAVWKRNLESMAISSLTISAEGFEHINATAEFIGSGKTSDSTLDIPDMPALAYLTSNYAVIKLGTVGTEDVSARVRSWSVTFNNNPREDRGYFPGSQQYRGRLEIGARSVVPTLVVDFAADSDLLDNFLADDTLKLEILCEGALADDPHKHTLKLEFPRLQYTALPIEDSDGILTYVVNFSEESVLYNVADTPPLCQATVINKQTAYLIASV